jgi:molybdate transport system substrate-binding protein
MPRAELRQSVRGIGRWLAVASAILLSAPAPAYAGEVKVAVAANFTEAAREIGTAFAKATGHEAVFSFGSTGQLYTQVTQDAPFEVFLAADRAHPEKAVNEGLAEADSRFTYATGRIVLFSKDKDLVKGAETLREAAFAKIAIANPGTAPYGRAAVETMKNLGVYEALQPRIVQGNNIAQTYQFVATENAEIGFVALSQVANHQDGSRWIVPGDLYSPIAQDAVLLKKGAESEAAAAFVEFLRGDEAKAIKEKYGYGPGSAPAG